LPRPIGDERKGKVTMKNNFGPWTTALHAGTHLELSTFWKRRMTRLLPTSESAVRLSRRSVLGIVAVGILACLLPTFQDAPVQAEEKDSKPQAKSKGRIFVNANLRYKPEGKDQEENANIIIAIDPETGKWQKITDKGFSGRVSPDGQTLIFNNNNELWNCDTIGGHNPGKIADMGHRPIWSGDGKYIVSTKFEEVDGHWKDETWRYDADGSNPTKLPIPDTDSVDDWSPDGKWFVTCSDRHEPRGHGYQLYLMKTDGTEQRRLTKDGLNCYARFSPDSRKVLYIHQTAKEGNGIWVVDVDGKNAKEIVKEENLLSPDGAYWSPDGKQIAVVLFTWELDENGRKVGRAGSEVANYHIDIMDLDGKNRHELKLADAKVMWIGSLGDWR
jgi:Tol biopolymer transport system component